MLRALIGSNGTIGASILDNITVDRVYNSDNLEDIAGHSFDRVIVAAPSGNRLAVNRGQVQDLEQCERIVAALATCAIKELVLIGSVDAVTAPNTEYGSNRAWLEQHLANQHNLYTLRLCTLIGKRIKKNMLYDIKHGLFLEKIDAGAVLQWCILDDVPAQIERVIAQGPGSVNIVSEPIANRTVLQRFCPELVPDIDTESVRYNQQPYVYNQTQIFMAMEQYLQ